VGEVVVVVVGESSSIQVLSKPAYLLSLLSFNAWPAARRLLHS